MYAVQYAHSFRAEGKENLEVVHKFKYITPEPSDIVECLYKTALHTCDLLALDRPFLFPSIYNLMQYLAEQNVNLSAWCVSKSRLLIS